jgi:ubiquitin-conjugating enzyme E2 S
MQSSVLRRIMRELRGLQETPLDDIRVSINEDDVLQFQGIIAGPGARVFLAGVICLVPRPGKALQLRNDDYLLTTRIEGTPYHGGWFRVGFTFGDDFPASPPKCESVCWI